MRADVSARLTLQISVRDPHQHDRAVSTAVARRRRAGALGRRYRLTPQILLDLQAVKSFLLKRALFGGDADVPSAHARNVTKQVGRLDSLLQVIMAPEHVRVLVGAALTCSPPSNSFVTTSS